MKIFRDQNGFTIIELMVTVALMGIILAIAMPAMTRYNRKEDTRGTAQDVSGWFTDARARAVQGGRMTFLVFEEPTNGLFPFEEGQFASLLTDVDGNGLLDETDTASPIYLRAGTSVKVTRYTPTGTALDEVTISPDDMSGSETSPTLGELADGTTLPVSEDLGVAAVAFSPQGAPVAVDTPDQWGTGAGGVYLTDNDEMVLGVLLMPLGEVKVQALNPATGEWK